MIQLILDIKTFFDQLLSSIISIFKILVFADFRPQSNPEINHKNCVILGNGPSLNDSMNENLSFMYENDLFCVNLFATSVYFTQLKPQNYLLLDEAFLNPKHEMASKAINSLVADTKWPLNLFVSHNFKKSAYFKEIIIKNKNIKPIYFNYVIAEGFDSLRFWFYKRDIGMPQCQNVLVALVFKCINLGYKNIYVFGADHTWHETLRLDENNDIILNDTHFYGTKTHKTSEIVSENESYMAKQFLSLHKAFKGYEVLARYAKFRGVKVLNASKRSYIDVFEKIKLS